MMPTSHLFKEALLAPVAPGRVFGRIPPDVRMNYRVVVALIALWGIPYAYLHFWFLEGAWMTASPLADAVTRMRILTFVVGSVSNWLLCAIGIAMVCRVAKRPVSLGRCEVAAFYIWMVWALMPLVDSVHLLGMPRRMFFLPSPVGGVPTAFVGHAAWLVGFPWLLLELTVVLHLFAGLPRWFGWVPAVLALWGARTWLEPMAAWTTDVLGRRGLHVDIWAISAGFAALGLATWCAIRAWLAGGPRWPAIVLVGLGTMVSMGLYVEPWWR